MSLLPTEPIPGATWSDIYMIKLKKLMMDVYTMYKTVVAMLGMVFLVSSVY